MIIGHGSYGEVKAKDGKAVKTFSKLSHLVQEYIALQYLEDCKYIVHSQGVDFSNLELNMELFDCSLRVWFEQGPLGPDGPRPTYNQIMRVIRDVLMGLVELHDRALAHGDLKPGNILIKRDPLRAVLGDCGFVSIAKYAKVDRTAAIYRDPVIGRDSSHDMYSFGILFLEMVADIRINRQATYGELRHILREKIDDLEHRKILYNLLHEDKARRPSARTLLHRLFHESPPQWIRPTTLVSEPSTKRVQISILNEDRLYIRKLMKVTAHKFQINRGKKGYGALIAYIDSHRVESSLFRIYTAITLMILSAVFGTSGFRENEVIELCERKYDRSFIYKVLKQMLSDQVFINILLAP